MDFPIINDGEFHTYEINLSGNDNWLNYNIGQIEFSTIPGGPANNGWAEFEWISTSATGPTDAVVVNPPGNGPGDPVVVAPNDPSCVPGCATILVERLR